MSTNLIAKPRRFRVTLWSLDTDLNPVEELTEVLSFTATFTMGSIPMASVGIPHGVEVNTDQYSKLTKELDIIVKEKAPLGVVVEHSPEVLHATTSTINSVDQYDTWPDTRVIVFKGYAAARAFSKNATTITSTLHIQHWLADLTAISLYSPRSHCTNPAAFGMDVCTIGGAAGTAETPIKDWGYIESNLMELADNDEGVMPLLKTLITDVIHLSDEDLEPSSIGSISPEYVIKTENALARVDSYLEWKEDLMEDISQLGDYIVAAIGSECAATFTNATAWAKLNSDYAGMFYYALAPAVSVVRAIPVPGVISRQCVELTEDDIHQFQLELPTGPVLGGCIMVYHNGDVNEAAESEFALSYIYPDVETNVDILNDSVGGPLCAVSLPPWLQLTDVKLALESQDELMHPFEPLAITPRMEDAIYERRSDENAWRNIAKDLVAFSYMSKVFADRRAMLTMPFRADICPGACVHISIAPVVLKAEDTIDVYATVQSITLNISSSMTATTSITLNNIRNAEEYWSDMYNPDTCPFYNQVWSGAGVPLYEPF